jgi:hypothetical protein
MRHCEETIMSSSGRKAGRFVPENVRMENMEWGLVCSLILVALVAALVIFAPTLSGLWHAFMGHVPTP